MNLEDYFDFFGPDDIRLKGTRIGLETILLDYLELGLSPDMIAERYPSLSMEQVYGTITYYWHNRNQVEAYLSRWKVETQHRRDEQTANPPAAVLRVRQKIRERQPIQSS